jgi:NTE family protein
MMSVSSPGKAARPRIAVVLSGGGLRGAGHIGVLQQLVAHDIPIDVIVGSSAGAVVAAYYAAVGLSLDELERDARAFRGRHLLAHSLNVRLHRRFEHLLRSWSGVIPHRLEQLEAASFDTLSHGIRALGIVCHDVQVRQPSYFSTGQHRGVRLSEVVRASASMPGLFPAVPVTCDDGLLHLSDGGISDCLPVAFARRPPLSATHVIVSDCRSFAAGRPQHGDDTVFIRPPLFSTGALWSSSSTLIDAVRRGSGAVTQPILERVDRWLGTLDDDAAHAF